MRLRWLRAFVPLAWMLIVVQHIGCADSGPPKPPEVMYGHDKCAACGMIVSEDRHAGALVSPGTEPLVFDDCGELARHVAQNRQQREATAFVHDYQTRGWLEASAAYFVIDPKLSTPMGTGTVAFGLRSDAEEFAQPRNVPVLRWEEVVNAH